MIFLENVKHLLTHDDGRTFAVIKSALEKSGYHLKYEVLNATTHGNLPQNRERIYIVGFLDKVMCDRFKFPEAIPLTKRLFGDVIDLADRKPAKYYLTNMDSVAVRRVHAHIVEKNIVYQHRRSMVRANKSCVCPTLTDNMGLGGHNVPLILDDYGVRRLTPRECFDLQGFPADFKIPVMPDAFLYKQTGNSIPLPVVSRIAENIIKALSGKKC